MPAFDEQDYTKSFQWGIWKRLMPVMRPYRRDFAGMFAFNLITAAIDVVLPLFQRYAISNYIEAGTLSGLLPYTLCYFGVILLQALSVVAFARNSMKIEMCAGRDMRANLFTHLQTLSFSFYNVTPVGYLLSRVMSDTSRIASMVAWNLTDILWAMFYVLGTFAAMLLLNWKLALVVIVIVPVIAVLTGYFQNRILHWNRRVRKLNSRITGAFNEGITGAKTSKTLGIEEQNTASFRALTKEMHDCGIRAARLNAVYIPLVLFCSTAAVAIVLLRGGYMVQEQVLQIATLSAFTTYAVGIFEPIVDRIALLICFQSMILDMAGNVGTQSLAVTIRVLMDEDISAMQKLGFVFKEMRIGFLNGLLLGSASFVVIGIFIHIMKQKSLFFSFALSGCVGISLLTAMVISSLVGVLVPMLFHKLKVDPAVASGPLITTVNDLVAVVTYYGLAEILLVDVFHLV